MSHSDAFNPSYSEPCHGKEGCAQTELLLAAVGDIAIAVREELTKLVPQLLAPIFDEFHQLKITQDKFVNSIFSKALYKPGLKESSKDFCESEGQNDDREPRGLEYLSASPSKMEVKVTEEVSNALPGAAVRSSSVEGLYSTSALTELGAQFLETGTVIGTSAHVEDTQAALSQTRQDGSTECVTQRSFSPKFHAEASKVSSTEFVTPTTLGSKVDREDSKSTGMQVYSIEFLPAAAVGSSRDGDASQPALLKLDSVEHVSAFTELRPSVAVQTEFENDAEKMQRLTCADEQRAVAHRKFKNRAMSRECSVEAIAEAGDAVGSGTSIDVTAIQTATEEDEEFLNLPDPPLALSARAWLPNALRAHSHRSFVRVTGYTQLLDSQEEQEEDEHDERSEATEIRDPEGAKRLSEEIASLEAEKVLVGEYLNDLESLFAKRAAPYKEDMAKLHAKIEEKHEHLEEAKMPKVHQLPPPGPVCLQFVDGNLFGAVCNVLVLLNLICMAVQPEFKKYAGVFEILDNVFLIWYVFELASKLMYYQKHFMIGQVSVVWWNWLDSGIVVGGVLDQWLVPLLTTSGASIDASNLRALRLLRLFRLLRFLRIVKAFLKSDLAWTNGHVFELFMAGVIAFNSVAMALELDVPWAGWNYVENVLLVVYSFEVSLRLKHMGWHFFVDCDNIVWHYLDFIMVVGGILDQWIVPLVYSLQSIFGGRVHHHSDGVGNVLRLLKIMRILRVLRLVKLLQMIRPLYTLLVGVMESVRAMRWVMILTLLTLYACAIVFTNLVGKGLMHDGHVSDDEAEFFGSVSKSLFSLFKLMNGDTAVVEPITDSVVGQLLFVGFMVVSNWSILAILTSVVSDNMISSSQRHNDEEEERERELDHADKLRRLSTLFAEIDITGNSRISSEEWKTMMEDDAYHHEICDATGLTADDLNDYFECLAEDVNAVVQKPREKDMDYKTFMAMLRREGTAADQRSILRVLSLLRSLENRVNEIQLAREKCGMTI